MIGRSSIRHSTLPTLLVKESDIPDNTLASTAWPKWGGVVRYGNSLLFLAGGCTDPVGGSGYKRLVYNKGTVVTLTQE